MPTFIFWLEGLSSITQYSVTFWRDGPLHVYYCHVRILSTKSLWYHGLSFVIIFRFWFNTAMFVCIFFPSSLLLYFFITGIRLWSFYNFSTIIFDVNRSIDQIGWVPTRNTYSFHHTHTLNLHVYIYTYVCIIMYMYLISLICIHMYTHVYMLIPMLYLYTHTGSSQDMKTGR